MSNELHIGWALDPATIVKLLHDQYRRDPQADAEDALAGMTADFERQFPAVIFPWSEAFMKNAWEGHCDACADGDDPWD